MSVVSAEASAPLPPCAALGPSETRGPRMRARSSDSSAAMSVLARMDSACQLVRTTCTFGHHRPRLTT